MGNKNTKVEEPQKSQDEIMKERWMKLGETKKEIPIKTSSNENIDRVDETNNLIENIKIKKDLVENEQNKNLKDEIKIEDSKEEIITSIDNKKIISNIQSNVEKVNENRKEELIIPEETHHEQINIVKKIDKENSTIEKVFRISILPSDKFTHLSLYQADLLSQNQEEVFRLNDLDNIMISIINEPDKRKNIIQYFLETYHRAVEMIERRYKSEFDERFLQIRKMTASYLALIIYSPENFELNLNKMDSMRELSKYYNETDDEEIEFLLGDIITSTNADYNFMREVFSYFLNIIHMDNISQKSNFFQCEKIKRNLRILSKILNDNPQTRKVYVTETNFLPKGINGKSFQLGTYLGLYLNLVPFESDVNQIKSNFSSLHQNESDNQVRVNSNKLNNLMNDLSNLFFILIEDKESMELTLTYFYELITANLDRLKMYANPYTTSSIGFLMNSLFILLKLFFEFNKDESIFEIIKRIDILYCVTTENVNFHKFDRTNPSLVKDLIETEMIKQNEKINEFNMTTKFFFLTHFLINYFIKNLDDEYTKIAQQISEMFKNNMTNDPKFKELYGIMRGVDVYLRSNDFMKYLMKFLQITSVYSFTLNNKKYKLDTLMKFDLSDFLQNFYENLETQNVTNLSMLPSLIFKNILNTSLTIRKFASESLVADLETTKVLVYFGIIYSSQVDLIQNPHLRAEIFDILLYFFISNSQERNHKQNLQILKLLNDPFVKDNLIYSIMRVFIDAERLGTSNQFYEKFSIRNKVLLLVENIMKTHKNIYTEKILHFANNYRFDCIKMVNLLMNDLTFLIDECIERLMQIKKYQDLKADVERFNAMDQETRQMEETRFQENDNRVKTELKLFNSSMNFMLIICQFCQDNFMSLKLSEKLANLLNYALDVFTSKKNLQLKITHMTEYGFDPKFILNAIVSIYVSFKDYKEFLEYVVQDERSFKIDNFERVISLKENDKISLDYDKYQDFKNLVETLKIINYDDAPEEFLDPITTYIMEDPVILPTSNIIVDRSTITTHLISDPTDPFNRRSLKIEDLISNEELKEKIQIYKKLKLDKK